MNPVDFHLIIKIMITILSSSVYKQESKIHNGSKLTKVEVPIHCRLDYKLQM